MFQIRHDKSCLHSKQEFLEKGFQFDAIEKLCFQGVKKHKKQSNKALFDILDWLESNYRMYQYKKDNGVKFGEHELFYWSNGDSSYFSIDINHNIVKSVDDVVKDILAYAQSKLKDIDGYIRLQYGTIIDWDRINAYIMETDFDEGNIPLNALSYFSAQSQYVGNRLTAPARNKLNQIEKQVLDPLLNKKIVWVTATGVTIEGTLRQGRDGSFRLFKPRATKTYYPIGLKNANQIKAA